MCGEEPRLLWVLGEVDGSVPLTCMPKGQMLEDLAPTLLKIKYHYDGWDTVFELVDKWVDSCGKNRMLGDRQTLRVLKGLQEGCTKATTEWFLSKGLTFKGLKTTSWGNPQVLQSWWRLSGPSPVPVS